MKQIKGSRALLILCMFFLVDQYSFSQAPPTKPLSGKSQNSTRKAEIKSGGKKGWSTTKKAGKSVGNAPKKITKNIGQKTKKVVKDGSKDLNK